LAIASTLALGACSGPGWWRDLWLTRDQQGQLAFAREEFTAAAALFEDPMWRGTSLYLDERFEAASAEFARTDSAEAWFARGNALAHLERYEEAIAAYRQALVMRPDYSDAEANIEYLQPFLPLDFTGGVTGVEGRDAAADEVVFDADADMLDAEGKETTVEEEGGLLTDEQMAGIWLRQVDVSPASFLRQKFAYQAARPGGE
jgi:Ca-activated chloride channel family protein